MRVSRAAPAAMLCVLLPFVADAQRSRSSRVPVNHRNGSFGQVSSSVDGRILVYHSDDPELTGATLGVSDIFVHDRGTGTTTPLGLSSTGGFSYIGNRAMSQDGRYVTFTSSAALFAGDINNAYDVFVYDRQTGQYRQISVGESGQRSSFGSSDPSMSADGRYVAFAGHAGQLGAGGSFFEVLVADRATGQLQIASRRSDGTPSNAGGGHTSISRDGRYVSFVTSAALVPQDTNGTYDVYVYDRQTSGITRVSVNTSGAQGGAILTGTDISGNGRFVAWEEWGNNGTPLLPDDTNAAFDVLVRDRDVDQDGIFDEPGAVRTLRASESDAGIQGNANSFSPLLSDSGRILTFPSVANNLLGPGVDTNQDVDVFLLDLDSDGDGVFLEPGERTISRVAIADDGSQVSEAGGTSLRTALPLDGRLVLMSACANTYTLNDPSGCDIFVVDRLARKLRDLQTATTSIVSPQVSGDGVWVAFASADATLVAGDTNGAVDVFVRDRRKAFGTAAATLRVSVTSAGAQALGGASDQPSISSDGRFVVFRSAATNLAAGDGNGVADIFLHDRDTDRDGVYDEAGAISTRRINVATGGAAPVGGASETPRISGDGRFAVYASLATNLTSGASPFRQVYLYDIVNAITVCMSERNGAKADADAITPAVSNAGLVAFATAATNLSPIDVNGQSDVYTASASWPYTAPRVLSVVSQMNGVAASGASSQPFLSPAGRLAFTSTAALSGADTNGLADVYLVSYFSPAPYTSTLTTFLLISEGPFGAAFGPSGSPSVGDGAASVTVAYASSASNLVHRDLNGVDDVFRAEVVATGGTAGQARQELRSRQSRISLRPDGLESSVAAGGPSVSADGSHIEFEQALSGGSGAGSLVAAIVGPGKGTANQPAAQLTSFRPMRGPASGGTIVEFVGTGLGDPDLVPTLNGVAMTVLDRGPEFIRAVTPPGTGSHVPGLNGPPDLGKAISLFTFTYDAAAACVVGAAPAVASAPAVGGPLALTISDAQNCGWYSRADVDWIGPDGAGTGNQASFQLTIQPNPEPGQRRGHVTIGTSVVEVVQDGAACAYDLSSGAAAVGPEATTVAVLLRAASTCGWSASSNRSWITFAGVAMGAGSYELRIAVAENNDAGAREGAVEVGGRQFAITQTGETFSTLTVSRSAGGRVTSQPTGIDCGTSCTAGYAQGTLVTLTPIADSGYLFDGWSGACNGQAACGVTLDVDRSVTALFREAPQTTQALTITTSGAGVVASAPAGISCEPDCAETYPTGTTVTLTATPASGWRFATWGGAGCGAVVQMTADRNCVATFERVQTATYGLTLQFNGSGRGRVTSLPAGLDCTVNCTQTFAADTTIVLTPTPEAGSTFGGWGGDPACVSGAFQLTQAMTCTVFFESNTPQTMLSVTVMGSGRVTSIPTGLDCASGTCTFAFPASTVVRLVAIPAIGQSLSAWSGACTGNRACLVSMRQPTLVTARFAAGGGQPIQVTGVRPRSGTVGGATKVRITGTGFAQPGPSAGIDPAVSVVIGNTPALAVEVISDTEMVAVTGTTPVPAGSVVAGIASVVSTADVTVNVNGSVAIQPAAWRNVVLDGSLTTDTDADGLPDQYEATYSLDPLVADDQADADGDGATNLQEYQAGTHPQGRYTRYLAEGATGSFFNTRVNIANPFTVPATTLLRFQTAGVVSPSTSMTIPGETRRFLYPAGLPTLASADFATVVESDVQLAVDRSMFWNPTIYGSHAGTSVDAPSTTWYLAEGATHGRFDLFYLLQNPGTQDAAVRVRFLRPSLPPLERTYTVRAGQRLNIYVDEIPQLAATDVSAAIESTNAVPIIVERAMYVTSPTGRAFEGGHESAGVTAPSTDWFLAEGATGTFFDTYVLIANPSSTAADVTATYLLPTGATVQKTYAVPANSRRTIWVDGEDPRLAATSVSTVMRSTNGVPIIVERSMWWPGIESVQGNPATFPILWGEAHNSPGSTETGTAWAVGDGESGPTPVNTRTYLLVANTSAHPATVRVTLLSELDLPPLRRDYVVPANGRFTVSVADDFPETLTGGFGGYGSLIESLATDAAPVPAQIVVERAMYSNSADGIFWAAGTNILAMKLR